MYLEKGVAFYFTLVLALLSSVLANVAYDSQELGLHVHTNRLELNVALYEEYHDRNNDDLHVLVSQAVHMHLKAEFSKHGYVSSSVKFRAEPGATSSETHKNRRIETLREEKLDRQTTSYPPSIGKPAFEISVDAIFLRSSIRPKILRRAIRASLQKDNGNSLSKLIRNPRRKTEKASKATQVPTTAIIQASGQVRMKHNQDLYEKKQVDQCSPRIQRGVALRPNEFICSVDGSYFFGLNGEGDIGLWCGIRQVWATADCCRGDGEYLEIQKNGVLVVRTELNETIWEAKNPSINSSSVSLVINGNGTVAVEAESTETAIVSPPFDKIHETCESYVFGKRRYDRGDRICSADMRFAFGLSKSGDLSLWEGPKTVWSSASCCDKDNVARLQDDGNLVVRDSNSAVLWSSDTNGLIGDYADLFITNNGVVTVRNKAAGKSWMLIPGGFEVDPAVVYNPEFLNEFCTNSEESSIFLGAGDILCSEDGHYRFGITLGGDLALFGNNEAEPLWSSGTCCGYDGVHAQLDEEGSEVLVKAISGETLWTSETKGLGYTSLSLAVDTKGFASLMTMEGQRIWAVPPPGSFVTCKKQKVGKLTLRDNEFLCSPNGLFRFGMFDGDLSLWNGSLLMWSSGACCGRTDLVMKMRKNGNMVVITPNNRVTVFSTKTRGNHGASVKLDNDGIVKIVSRGGVTVWMSTGDTEGLIGPTTLPTSYPSHDTSKTPSSLPSIVPSVVPSNAPTVTPTSLPSTSPSQTPTAVPSSVPSAQRQEVCIYSMPGRTTVFNTGEFVCSQSEDFRFGLTLEGDLALLSGNQKIWSARTCCSGASLSARLQLDGNLVVSDSSGVLWASGTSSNEGASIRVGDDGVASIFCPTQGHIWSTAAEKKVDPNTLDKKVMAGYQGWFFTDSDGGLNRWHHWSWHRTEPNENTTTIDLWPDLTELEPDELHPTGFTYKDGSVASVYSAYNTKTVERHCKWMREYGIDGVFVQRFINSAVKWTPIIDQVLRNARSGSEKHGRTFAVMYDISNGVNETFVDDVIKDWKHLVDEEYITKSHNYLRHRGRPLVAIWGFGFSDRIGEPNQAASVLEWFRNTDDKYRATVMGGVPTGWRDLSLDSKTDPQWTDIYRSFDVISPWTVGRMRDNRGVDNFRENYIEPDLKECLSNRIDYLPVAFPGFSSHNLYPTRKPFNEIPRNAGTFMWRQLYNVISAGSSMVYIAMFDEVDEGTAIFKIAESALDTPAEGRFLTFDQDEGFPSVPGDWYLNLTGTAARLLSQGVDFPEEIPA